MTRRLVISVASVLLAYSVPAFQEPSLAQDKKPKAAVRFEIDELGKKVFHASFAAGVRATVKARGADDTEINLHIEEMDGTYVVSDLSEGKDAEIVFTPLKNKTYRISVLNLGPGANTCTLTHTGKDEKIDFGTIAQTKPIKIADETNHTITTKLEEGKWAAVWVTSEQTTDVDVYVFDPDGKQVAKDEHFSRDAFVSFLPKRSGTYRIEVRNLGQGDNVCTVKYTTTEEIKKEKKDKK